MKRHKKSPTVIEFIQKHSLFKKFFTAVPEGLLEVLIVKIDKQIIPSNLSMNDKGKVTLGGKIACKDDFDKSLVTWYYDAVKSLKLGFIYPFALVGCVNRLYKEYQKLY